MTVRREVALRDSSKPGFILEVSKDLFFYVSECLAFLDACAPLKCVMPSEGTETGVCKPPVGADKPESCPRAAGALTWSHSSGLQFSQLIRITPGDTADTLLSRSPCFCRVGDLGRACLCSVCLERPACVQA